KWKPVVPRNLMVEPPDAIQCAFFNLGINRPLQRERARIRVRRGPYPNGGESSYQADQRRWTYLPKRFKFRAKAFFTTSSLQWVQTHSDQLGFSFAHDPPASPLA